jgi:hypothetical protein
MQRRRLFKHNVPLHDRLNAWSNEVRERAAMLPPGDEQDDLLKKAGQADTASHINDWVNSPGLQPPKSGRE